MEELIKLVAMNLLLGCYIYYVFTTSNICDGKAKDIIFVALALVLVNSLYCFGLVSLGVLLVILETLLFVYFYTDNLFLDLWLKLVVLGLYILICTIYLKPFGYFNYVIAFVGMSTLIFIMVSRKRGYLRLNNLIIVLIINILLTLGDFYVTVQGKKAEMINIESIKIHVFFLLLSFCVFLLLEVVLKNYELGYQNTSKALQEKLMETQYNEIKNVYLNMRGWRHDYHNHVQVLKANLDSNNGLAAREYLNEIEHELKKVDTFIKSGNMMVDAILNSKLSLAMEKDIKIICDAYLPKELFITDIDLCTMLGNVLDNAIESCEKIEESHRFIRIYIAMVKEQFYLSIQNGSVEAINFHQENYISTKRGNHGLGMKRVAAVVGRWGGYLNINQEAGVFGTEITIPKP